VTGIESVDRIGEGTGREWGEGEGEEETDLAGVAEEVRGGHGGRGEVGSEGGMVARPRVWPLGDGRDGGGRWRWAWVAVRFCYVRRRDATSAGLGKGWDVSRRLWLCLFGLFLTHDLPLRIWKRRICCLRLFQ
jgi:hypothetical protein